MTREEFYDKYGDVVVRFSSYYKFVFTYKGTLEDGSTISVGYGGDSDEIYRFELTNNEESTVERVQPFCGSVFKDGKEVEGFYDY